MNNNILIKKLLEKADEIKEYQKNEIIFKEHDLCDRLAIVIFGEVSIASFTYNGDEILFKKIISNEVFGQSLIFSSSPFYKGMVICHKNSKIAFIKKDVLLQSLSNPSLLEIYLKLISDEILLSKEKSRMLSFNHTQDRLLYMLYAKHEISFLSITSLAKELSVTRESLSRSLKSLCRKNLIVIEGKCIRLKK